RARSSRPANQPPPTSSRRIVTHPAEPRMPQLRPSGSPGDESGRADPTNVPLPPASPPPKGIDSNELNHHPQPASLSDRQSAALPGGPLGVQELAAEGGSTRCSRSHAAHGVRCCASRRARTLRLGAVWV